MLRKIIAQIKVSVECIKAQVKLAKGDFDVTLRYLDEIAYYVSDVQVRSTGGCIALTCKDIFGQPIILVDNLFETLPKNLKKAILYHEIGHQVNGDLEKSDEELRSEFKKRNKKNYLSQQEVEADKYACKMTSKEDMIEMFDTLEGIYNNYGAPTIEIVRRREIIKEMTC